MPTPHINAKEEDIAKLVLMPGDPLRAKYIAENFLEDAKLVNTTRNMFAYTGTYKGKRVTVFSHGMGIPSVGIYAYELFKFYGVEKAIRIGTCGTNNRDIKLQDVVLADSSYSISTFPKQFGGETDTEYASSKELTDDIENTAKELNISINRGRILTSDVFDVYVDDHDKFLSNFPNPEEFLAVEMESFCLFYLAQKLHRDAACLLTVVDSPYDKRVVTSEDREKSLNDMIKVALETIIKY